ncbi:MAG: hypothetical protein ACIALR_17090 [Blastopirellula sp. JB062]
MPRNSIIANCLLCLATLLAPVQATLAADGVCDHCRDHAHEAEHSHSHGERCHSCGTYLCDAHAWAMGRSDCCCHRHAPAQQPIAPSYSTNGEAAICQRATIAAPKLASPRRLTKIDAGLRPAISALDKCAALCRFLT